MQILGDAGSWGFVFANLSEEWWLSEKKISGVKLRVSLVFYLGFHFIVVVKHSSWFFLADAASLNPGRLSAVTAGMCDTRAAGPWLLLSLAQGFFKAKDIRF